jgi:hypothetical protein
MAPKVCLVVNERELNNSSDREHPPGTVKEEAADRFALTGG